MEKHTHLKAPTHTLTHCLPPTHTHTHTHTHTTFSLLPILNTLLDKSSDKSVRLAVGQAIALLFELIREADESLLDDKESETTYDVVQQLATESDRHTARKDRNQQRSCFKDVLQTLDVRCLKFGSVELNITDFY